MRRSHSKPSAVATDPNSGMLAGPSGARSKRSMSSAPARGTAAAKRSGRRTTAPAAAMAPTPAPSAASRCGLVNPKRMRNSAQAMKSRIVFSLAPFCPARCQASPYSPPPRTWAKAMMPPRSSQARRLASKTGVSEAP